jgi:hypothetical protein
LPDSSDVPPAKSVHQNPSLWLARNILLTKDGKAYAGVSKRNPIDGPRIETGLDIACTRAYLAITGAEPGYNRQRPVSKRAAKLASNTACLEALFDGLAEEAARKAVRADGN